MSMFINQMLGCLIIAAGIGGVVGWLLRNVSAGNRRTTARGRHRHDAPQRADAGKGTASVERRSTSKLPPGESGNDAIPNPQPFQPRGPQCKRRLRALRQSGCRYRSTSRATPGIGVGRGMVEWLDIQLTERDEKHRSALHEVELQLAERDQRIRELEQLQKQAEAREAVPTDKAA